ncbi:MAG: alpha/beta fold hydrolase [Bacteroidales bacterium]|nr:alpha/beta fold hydrolase [Bacteroidales bacterium]MBQ7213707.1 alpha/beta fold hydrolase [Bacteroidales bacterium]
MRKIFLYLSACCLAATLLPAAAQEIDGNMPVFYQQLKATLQYPLSWEHAGIQPSRNGKAPTRKFLQWQARGRQQVLTCLSPAPPSDGRWNMETVAEEKRDGYTAKKILFNVNDWCRTAAYLLVPDGEGPHPAVLVLHDHGAHFTIGKEKTVRPFGVTEAVMKDAEAWTVSCYDGVFIGDEMARAGYVVLSTDALFWGERGRRQGADYDAQQALNANLEQMGMSFGSFIVWDDLRSADFLASLPMVKPGGIAVVGHSMGCYRAWTAAALSDAVKACVAVCWMNTTEHLMTLTNNQNKGGSAYSMIIPGIRNYMDYPDVASLACPKPVFFMNGRQDKLFPVEGVEDAYAIMRRVWQDNGAGEQFHTKITDGPHYYDKAMQREALEFLDSVMK